MSVRKSFTCAVVIASFMLVIAASVSVNCGDVWIDLSGLNLDAGTTFTLGVIGRLLL